ncbi:uncharacterized protein LOC143275346 [Babylonia areolata]|uniref:uncharacterized protein LOC143275346 n=1 Tax=Babylonia areolata TaxID=304850 RepID=UPI003FD6B0AD
MIKMGSPPHVKKPSKMSRVKRRLKVRISLLPLLVVAAIILTVGVPAYKLYSRVYGTSGFVSTMNVADDPEMLPLHRDLYFQESWPEVEWSYAEPTDVHHTVHYLWCGQKTFRFQHYLGVLSVLRVVQPLKIVFHYTHLPVLDRFWYHTWFLELKQSVASLELRELLTDQPCGSVGLLRDALSLLAQDGGGIFVGEGIVLSKNVDHLRFLSFWFAFADPKEDPTRGVVFVNTGFNENTLEDYVHAILVNGPACVSVGDYDRLEDAEENSALCVSVTEEVFPRDIRSADSPFAVLARWLYYGRRRPFSTYHSGMVDLIPRVAHFTWMSGRYAAEGGPAVPRSFTFAHFLSVLSALHVAGMEHVYVHGDVEPWGPWWNELRTQNVTYVRLDPPNTVFEQAIQVPAHVSDIVRYSVLYKYGGVYQDTDILWVNHLPDWLLGYPAVACPEWPRYGEWPDTLNLGLLLARRHSPFLRHFLATYRYFRDRDWNFNAVLMPYRTYEWYPDTLFLDQFLQAICSRGVCHPAWLDDNDNDSDPTTTNDNELSKENPPAFSLREVRAIHLRIPKVPESLSSPEALRSGSDMFADVGRFILRQAGRAELLGEE